MVCSARPLVSQDCKITCNYWFEGVVGDRLNSSREAVIIPALSHHFRCRVPLARLH